MKRLFVPLTALAFEDFRDNGKEVEVRRCERQYAQQHIILERDVELRRGYSGASLWGTIIDVRTGTLDEVIGAYDLRIVEPCCANVEDAVRENRELLGDAERYIAFRMLIRK